MIKYLNEQNENFIRFLGMRLWFSSPDSQRIAYSFHAGYDFPISILQRLLSLNISLTQIWHSNLPSIRGLATFTSADQRIFVYQTPPIGTVPADLPSSYLNSKIFHFICSPNWASQHITEILKLRDKQFKVNKFKISSRSYVISYKIKISQILRNYLIFSQ